MERLSKKAISAFLMLFVLLLTPGCSKNEDPKEKTAAGKVEVSADGVRIKFAAGSPGLTRLKSKSITKGKVTISVMAPARVVASIASAKSSAGKFILFESSDIATLYSQYKQSRANLELTAKNLERVRDMYVNLAATGKDVNQAENDAANAKASMAEMESRLRTAGFNPKELEETPPGTIWLIADVLDNQLHEVEKNELVDVFFSSIPGKKFVGRAVAIGDVVDQTTRTVKVRVILSDPKGQFLPGMFCKVDFGDPHDNVMLLPLSSIVTVEGTDYVFVNENGNQFHRQKVILGEQNGTDVVVIQGIADGDSVVVDGAMLLKGLSFNF